MKELHYKLSLNIDLIVIHQV